MHPSARTTTSSWTGRHPRRCLPPPSVPPHNLPAHPNLDPRIAAPADAQPRHAQSARHASTARRPFRAFRTPSATSRRPAQQTRTRWAWSVPSAAPCCQGSTPRKGIGAGTRTRVASPQSGPSAREVVPPSLRGPFLPLTFPPPFWGRIVLEEGVL